MPNGRYAPRRPGEPSSRERLQQQSQPYRTQYSQPTRTTANRYTQPVRQPTASRNYSQSQRIAQPVQNYSQRPMSVPRSQRFAPTRPGEKRGTQKVSTKTVKTAYSIYKGYHSIKQATAKAQARTAEQLFVEAVEDTSSPPTVAKIITYPVKLVANVVVEVVRTVAVDLWKF